jgi:hypothetical protein
VVNVDMSSLGVDSQITTMVGLQGNLSVMMFQMEFGLIPRMLVSNIDLLIGVHGDIMSIVGLDGHLGSSIVFLYTK